MKLFKFEKESSGRWYVVLPDWTGHKDNLEMVSGADTMLDILAQGENEVDVALSLEPFEGCNMILHYKEGGNYDLKSDLYNFNVWLCYVTVFVFDEYPKTIYIA